MSNSSNTLQKTPAKEGQQNWDSVEMSSELLGDLNSALTLIGDRNDIEIAPTNQLEGGISSTLNEIALQSGVPIHRVRLRSRWHRSDHGDMLVLVQESDELRVFALLYSKTGYEIHDVRTGKSRKLDSKTRKLILPLGWTLVRTFENSKTFRAAFSDPADLSWPTV